MKMFPILAFQVELSSTTAEVWLPEPEEPGNSSETNFWVNSCDKAHAGLQQHM